MTTTTTKRGRGRPPKLTPELTQQIADVVSTGTYFDTAAVFCGVSKVTLHSWMKRGHEQQRGRYRDFLNAIEQARARADARDHAFISKAAAKDWRAAEAHLRLRNPSRYNVKRSELSGPDGKPIAAAVASSTEASLLALFQKLAGDDSDE